MIDSPPASSDMLLICDLDGTLADTRRDLAQAVNAARCDLHLAALPIPEITAMVGNGLRKLVTRAFADCPGADIATVLTGMKRHYAENLCVYTTLYPNVAETLRELRQAGLRIVCFTNKPGVLARTLLQELHIAEYFDRVIGDGDGFPLKPAPEAMIELQSAYRITPNHCFVVGDHYTDLEVARRTGCHSIFAQFGFGTAGSEQADFVIAQFSDLTRILSEAILSQQTAETESEL